MNGNTDAKLYWRILNTQFASGRTKTGALLIACDLDQNAQNTFDKEIAVLQIIFKKKFKNYRL